MNLFFFHWSFFDSSFYLVLFLTNVFFVFIIYEMQYLQYHVKMYYLIYIKYTIRENRWADPDLIEDGQLQMEHCSRLVLVFVFEPYT